MARKKIISWLARKEKTQHEFSARDPPPPRSLMVHPYFCWKCLFMHTSKFYTLDKCLAKAVNSTPGKNQIWYDIKLSFCPSSCLCVCMCLVRYIARLILHFWRMVKECNIWRMILESCAWRLISKCYKLSVQSERDMSYKAFCYEPVTIYQFHSIIHKVIWFTYFDNIQAENITIIGLSMWSVKRKFLSPVEQCVPYDIIRPLQVCKEQCW